MKVSVYVTPRKNVLDPQGAAVEHAMHSLGHTNFSRVRVGKTVEFEVDGEDGPQLRSALDKVCAELLANPVIEDYHYTVTAE